MSRKIRPVQHHITLTDEQVSHLHHLQKSKKLGITVQRRIQILLNLDEAHGKTLTRSDIVEANQCGFSTIYSVIDLFLKGGIENVITLKRNDASNHANQKMTGKDEAILIQLACGPAPEGYTRWSYSLLEEKAATLLEHPVKRDAIGRKLKKMKLNLTNPNTGQPRS